MDGGNTTNEYKEAMKLLFQDNAKPITQQQGWWTEGWQPRPAPCPSCGSCPTCGRGGAQYQYRYNYQGGQ